LPGAKTPLTKRGGVYPITGLSEGRDWAREALGDMARGIDPKAKAEGARKAEVRRKANSFAALAEEFIGRHVSKLARPAGAEATIRRELVSRWGEKPISEISRRDVVELLRAIADSGKPYAAHKTYNYITKFLYMGRCPRTLRNRNPLAQRSGPKRLLAPSKPVSVS
jgi:hypothetical protein